MRAGVTGVGPLGIVLAAVFMVSFDATVATAAFPALRAEFGGASPGVLSWTINAYTLVYAALLVPFGGWADARGREMIFRRGLWLFTWASAACGLAPSAAWLIAARGVQAVGAAMLTPAALALALGVVSVERRGRVVGWWTAVGAFAAAAGPGAGSWLIEAGSWRAVFWLNVPVGLCLAAWCGPGMKGRDGEGPTRGAVDWPGAALLALGAGGVAWAFAEAGVVDAGVTGARAGLGLVLLAFFVAWARGRRGAALDLGFFRDRMYRRANVATLIFGACFGMMFVSFYLFMTGVWGYGQGLAGLAATPGPVMVIALAALGGRIVEKLGRERVLVAGGLLFAGGHAWYLLRVGAEPDYLGAWLPGQLASGAGVGLLMPALGGAAVARLPAASLGAGNAVNQAVRQIGLALGVALAVGRAGAAEAGLAEFRVVYGWLVAGGLALAALAGGLRAGPAEASSGVAH
jgi:MFS family permease